MHLGQSLHVGYADVQDDLLEQQPLHHHVMQSHLSTSEAGACVLMSRFKGRDCRQRVSWAAKLSKEFW